MPGSSFGMRVANCVSGSSVFAIRPPSSSTPLAAQDPADACDGGDRSSASGVWAPPALPSSAPPSRQRSLVGGRDHLGATSLTRYDLCVNHWRQLACGKPYSEIAGEVLYRQLGF